MRNKQKPAVSELENKVMAVIWQHGEATADLVRTELRRGSPLKDSTVRTILRRLEEKGYVKHHSVERTFVYAPTVESQSVAAEAVQGIIERFCNGSVEDLLIGMVNHEVVSTGKLRELAQKIARAKSDSAKAKTKTPRRKGK